MLTRSKFVYVMDFYSFFILLLGVTKFVSLGSIIFSGCFILLLRVIELVTQDSHRIVTQDLKK